MLHRLLDIYKYTNMQIYAEQAFARAEKQKYSLLLIAQCDRTTSLLGPPKSVTVRQKQNKGRKPSVRIGLLLLVRATDAVL